MQTLLLELIKKNSYFSHAVKLHCFMRVKLKPKNSLWETSSQLYIYIYIYNDMGMFFFFYFNINNFIYKFIFFLVFNYYTKK